MTNPGSHVRFGLWVWLRLKGLRFRVEGSGFKHFGCCWVWGVEFRVSGLFR